MTDPMPHPHPLPVPALGETLADPGPLPEEPEMARPGDLLAAIRVADAEALMVLAQRVTGVRPETSAMDVLFRVSEAVNVALADPAGRVTVSAADLAEVLGDAEGFIGGKDNAAFSRLAAAAGVA
jgi:hypothetical protein